MWEWRIFFKEIYSSELELTREYVNKLNNNPVEKRTDYYYDFSLPELGLKERGSSRDREFKPILELKALIEKKDWGAELWKKFIKYPVSRSINPEKGLTKKGIKEILKYEKKESPIADKIEIILSKLGGETQERVKVKKKRSQMKDIYRFNHSQSMFKLERTKINIFGEYWYTICIESPNSELLRQFINHQILNLPKNILGGYPEFISNLNQ